MDELRQKTLDGRQTNIILGLKFTTHSIGLYNQYPIIS